MPEVIVVGAGMFGLCAARALLQRGWKVQILDPGPVPHPAASSTDLSKIIRMDYGDDALYLNAMEKAFPIWRSWNTTWDRPLYHETGFALLCLDPMQSHGFEHTSWTTLSARGAQLHRLSGPAMAERLPAFGSGHFTDGYINPQAGWAESGEVVARLAAAAIREGARLHADTRVLRIEGTTLHTSAGLRSADRIVIATGAWAPTLLPELAPFVRVVGQPVIHLQPADPRPWQAPTFLPWAGDISRTGWYGLPANRDGLVKLAHHGSGVPCAPDQVPEVTDDEIHAARRFLRTYLPDLADAPLAGTRRCLYADSLDGDFWITEVPGRPGVVVATGGSGHGFKFAPVMGDWIADAVEKKPVPPRFGWRTPNAWHPEHARAVQSLDDPEYPSRG